MASSIKAASRREAAIEVKSGLEPIERDGSEVRKHPERLTEAQITLDRPPTGALADRLEYVAGALTKKDGIGTAIAISSVYELFSEEDQLKIALQVGVLDLQAFKNHLSHLRHPSDADPHAAEWRKILMKDNIDTVLLFGEDKSLIGYIMSSPSKREGAVELKFLATDRENPVAGSGSFLLEAYLKRLCEAGVNRVEWRSESAATGFYEKVAARLLEQGRFLAGRLHKNGVNFQCDLKNE